MSNLHIAPITFKSACDFIAANHRHHRPPQGHKFSLALYRDDGLLVGVATCGRPVSRYLDDGLTLEITRLCTDGTYNACSMLYGACARVAKDMGYRSIITYILESESGASLKASGFVCDGKAGGVKWTGERDRGQEIPHEMKTRWVKRFWKEEEK